MGVAEKFESLVGNLRTDNDSTVSARRKAIAKRLNQDFWSSDSETAHTRYLGSYGRGTAIKGFSDVDLLAQLPYETYQQYNGYTGNGQSSLLQAVRNSILKTYPTTEVGGDGQVVVVEFYDGTRFEVLPAFLSTDGSYTHPDSNGGGRWRRTDPIPEIEAIDKANTKYNRKVKHLGRMARAWKRESAVPIGGLLIDTLVYNFMPTWSHNDKTFLYYDFMTRDFMKYLAGQDPKQLYWKAPGSGQYVYRADGFENKADKAYLDALEAIEHESNQQEYSANKCWKRIFGGFFSG